MYRWCPFWRLYAAFAPLIPACFFESEQTPIVAVSALWRVKRAMKEVKGCDSHIIFCFPVCYTPRWRSGYQVHLFTLGVSPGTPKWFPTRFPSAFSVSGYSFMLRDGGYFVAVFVAGIGKVSCRMFPWNKGKNSGACWIPPSKKSVGQDICCFQGGRQPVSVWYFW